MDGAIRIFRRFNERRKRRPSQESMPAAPNTTATTAIDAQASKPGHSDEDATSDTYFHSAIRSRRSASPSPVPAPVPNGVSDGSTSSSLLIVNIPSSSLEHLAQYELVDLASDDEHFPSKASKSQDIDCRLTFPDSTNPRHFTRSLAMGSPQSEDRVSTSLVLSEDVFEDGDAGIDYLPPRVMEPEDSNDEDWLPHVPKRRTRARSVKPTISSHPASAEKIFATRKAPELTSSSPALQSTPSHVPTTEVASRNQTFAGCKPGKVHALASHSPAPQNQPSRISAPQVRKALQPSQETKDAEQTSTQFDNIRHTEEIRKPKPTPIYETPSSEAEGAHLPSRRAQIIQSLIKPLPKGSKTPAKAGSKGAFTPQAQTAQQQELTSTSAGTVGSKEKSPKQLLSAIKSKYRAGLFLRPHSPSSGAAEVTESSQNTVDVPQKRKRSPTMVDTASKSLKQSRRSFPSTLHDSDDCEISSFIPGTSTTVKRAVQQKQRNRPQAQHEDNDYEITAFSPVMNGCNSLVKAEVSHVSAVQARLAAPFESSKADGAKMEPDSDIEMTGATPRNGASEAHPVEVDSDIEITRVTPVKHPKQTKPTATAPRKIIAPRYVKAEHSAPIIANPSGPKESLEIDLTMLTDSDTSGCDLGGDDNRAMGGEELCMSGNTTDNGLLGSFHGSEKGSSLCDEVSAAEDEASDDDNLAARDGHSASCSEAKSQAGLPQTMEGVVTTDNIPEASDRLQPELSASGLESSRIGSFHDDASQDGDSESSDSDVEEIVRRDMESWEWFDYREMESPFRTLKPEETETEAIATTEDELANCQANHNRWLQGNAFVSTEKQELERKLEQDNEERERKLKIKTRRMKRLVASTTRDGIRDGLIPRYVKPRYHESMLLLSARVIDFQLRGWKKRMVVSKQRKLGRCAKRVKAEECKRGKLKTAKIKDGKPMVTPAI